MRLMNHYCIVFYALTLESISSAENSGLSIHGLLGIKLKVVVL